MVTPASSAQHTHTLYEYLQMPLTNTRMKILYSFGKNYIATFPVLTKFTMKYAYIPATSVPTERVFSITGQVTGPPQ